MDGWANGLDEPNAIYSLNVFKVGGIVMSPCHMYVSSQRIQDFMEAFFMFSFQI